MPKAKDSPDLVREWTVQARCVVLKEFTVRGTREQAETLTGEIVKELEVDQLSAQVQGCQESA